MNTQSYFKSKDAYLNFRKAWKTRASKREHMDFSMQLLHRFLRGRPLHPAVSPRTKTDTLWRALNWIYSPSGICTLKEIMCWNEYDDWFNLDILEKELLCIRQECSKGMPNGASVTTWPKSERFIKLLGADKVIVQESVECMAD